MPSGHGSVAGTSSGHGSAAETAAVLLEALPYIRRFAGDVVVVKYGGNALAGAIDTPDAGAPEAAIPDGVGAAEDRALDAFARDVALLHAVGMRPVIVHGGGPQISRLSERLGKQPTFHRGLRVTDAETMEIVAMVLLGEVNPRLVTAINRHGELAVGVSGHDAGLLRVVRRDPALGFVGDVSRVEPAVLHDLLAAGRIPVVATIGTDADGVAHNVNADTAAAAISVALGARKYVVLTDVEGVRRDAADPASLVRRATVGELRALLATGALTGGMIPKVEGVAHAVESGVEHGHVLDGRVPHVLLLEFFTDAGVGTKITFVPDAQSASAAGAPR